MSLVNDMLRDLEQRNARASEPLAGVRPAVRSHETGSSRRIVLTSFFVFAVAAALVGLNRRDAVVAMPVSGVESLSQAAVFDTVAVKPAPERPASATLASLSRYRLDYRLANRPVPQPSSPPRAAPAPDTMRPPASELDVAGNTPDRGNTAGQSAPIQTPAARTRVVKTKIDPVVQLRRTGLAALQRGRAAEAEARFRELVALTPSATEAHLLLHRALGAQSRHAEAEAVLTAALEVSAEPARIASVLAHRLLGAGDAEAAQTLLEQYRGAAGSDLDYVALLAAVHERNGHYELAAEAYVYLVSEQPGRGAWWIGLAIATDALGRRDEARQAYERASRSHGLDPALARFATERLAEMDQTP